MSIDDSGLSRVDDLLDDHVRGHLLPKIMKAMEYLDNGDPLKDALDFDDEIEAFRLLSNIGTALGLKAAD